MKKILILILALSGNAWACEEHAFFRAGAGWTGELDDFEPVDDLAAQIELGYRWPISQNHWIDFKVTHHSYWFVGKPFNDDDEEVSDHINIGYEYRF